MKSLFRRLIESVRRAMRRHELERQLEQLDPHMLKDIGLEAWRGGSAGRLWAVRHGFY